MMQAKPMIAARRGRSLRAQAGMTIVELMVALVLGMLVAAASISALIVARQGYSNVDTNTQLRENSRFAASIIQRIVVQAGFANESGGRFGPKLPGLRGWDNALLDSANLPDAQVSGSRGGCGVTDTSCANGSDILRVSYFGVSRPPGDPVNADGSMINCAGIAEPEGANQAVSFFHVVRSVSGEPTLACTYRRPGFAAWETQALVAGVEGFQVLYGMDTLTNTGAAGQDSVADRYLRAQDVPAANWNLVRSIRVGIVLRGPVGSAVDKAASGQTINVLGEGFSDAADVGSALTVAADGRLRQRSVFTVHLRNGQGAP